MPDLKPETDVYVALAGDVADEAQQPVAELRSAGLDVAVDISGRKLAAQLKAADKKGVQYVLVIGENELKSGEYTLKNLSTGKEQRCELKEVIKTLKRRGR
jgi:histidyl-tRNA synthetase